MPDMRSTKPTPPAPARGARRGLRASAALLVVGAVLVASPASADPPETWEDTQREAPLTDLIFLIGVPVLAFAVIALLVYLPSMIRRQRGESDTAFGDEPEWFGGPRSGVEGAKAAVGTGDATAAGTDDRKGGASARW